MVYLTLRLRLTIKNEETGESLTIPAITQNEYFEKEKSVITTYRILSGDILKLLEQKLSIFGLSKADTSIDEFAENPAEVR